jgi:aryl-alcohol dehydrogenase-like predicted oxidoreductase
MEERPLGGNGIAITRIALGCGGFGGIGSAPAWEACERDQAGQPAAASGALDIHLSPGDRDHLTEVFS